MNSENIFFKGLNILRIPCLVLGICAPALLFPLGISLYYRERNMLLAYLIPISISLLFVVPVLISIKYKPIKFSAQQGFLIVSLTWVLISISGALPFALSGQGISFTDAVFESVCGFATTGATTISNVESLPQSLLLWRAMTHWLGGMGIVLLTVALMPMFGVGGFQLIKAETPGPSKEKVTPKITSTAKSLWLIYFGLTALLFALYLIGGMGIFDAVCHAFTVMASGGVSTKNAGVSYFNSPTIEIVSTVFMLFSALNFNIYYRFFKGKIKDIFYNTEMRAYLLIFITAVIVITVSIIPIYDGSVSKSIRYAAYQSASILSTTGSAITDYGQWPSVAQTVLLLLMFIGGCSGSTAGGIKVIRIAVLYKQALNEIRRLLNPQGIFNVRLNQKVGRKDIVYGVAGFMFLYLASLAVTTLITCASGVDVWTSFSASLAVLGNVGIGFGSIGPASNFGFFAGHIKWLYAFMMLAGRLELWTVFVIFRLEYWKQ
jgi:trk system potassium uptake protein TrkH